MFQLAQVNIARARAPLHDSLMQGFTSRLNEINTLGENSPGFVWRFIDDENDAILYRSLFNDPQLVFNMTVWESWESLKDFSYRSSHKELLVNRQQWFEHRSAPSFAMWWVESGHRPSIQEAKFRLDHLQEHGETEWAFSFRKPFARPGVTRAAAEHA